MGNLEANLIHFFGTSSLGSIQYPLCLQSLVSSLLTIENLRFWNRLIFVVFPEAYYYSMNSNIHRRSQETIHMTIDINEWIMIELLKRFCRKPSDSGQTDCFTIRQIAFHRRIIIIYVVDTNIKYIQNNRILFMNTTISKLL